jgi:DNA topoisomerase-1
MNVVVVESPAKATTINKYLGGDYTVLASYGHVRDLPSKEGSVRPDDDFAMDWEVDARGQKQIQAIAQALRGADKLYLATDPDREGEAISWHVRELLEQRKALKGVDVQRVVFHEITKTAVLEAMQHPRELDRELIDAYLARRALDYLVGFTLSPVLWRKLPGSRSAGRVQSVALRLICERESEIEVFKAREYWSVAAIFDTGAGRTFQANLTHLNGNKLDRYGLPDEALASAAKAAIETATFSVATIERKKVRRNPNPPFTTSTLQQEASRKLSFGARKTMSTAQRLYEGIDLSGETVGLITYMRTDGVQMSQEAITATRSLIGREYGNNYVPETPRQYKTRAKNAQEAHEAIRPTDISRRPEHVAAHLDRDQLRLYELVWKRTVASQMESAVLDQVAIDVADTGKNAILRATGSVIAFDGFLRLYQEGRDDPQADGAAAADGTDRILPPVEEDQALTRGVVTPAQHFTQPPPRYSEASLVKNLEELGIGRPSTYANIISVLQDRDYVIIESRRFIPEDRGRLVTAFLTSFFEHYFDYGFTAKLEEQLDDVAGGRIKWKTVLREFWAAFSSAIAGTADLRISHVLDALDELLGPHFFPEHANNGNPRACPSCDGGRLNLKLGKFGAFIGCSNYPECRYTRRLVVSDSEGDGRDSGPRLVGEDPETGLPISLRKGPYGHYVQLGEADEGQKPKRSSLPKSMAPDTINLERALGLLSLPRDIGRHPETGEVILAGLGRFGPYIKHEATYVSLKDDDVLTIGHNRAMDLLANAPKKTPAKSLGNHPSDSKPVTIQSGRYGPYVQHASVRATLPKGDEADSMTLERAIELIAAKAGRAGTKSKAKSPKAKAAKATATKAKAAKATATKAKAAKATATKAKAAKAKATKAKATKAKAAKAMATKAKATKATTTSSKAAKPDTPILPSGD